MAAEGSPGVAGAPAPTATLGELYLAQGHRREAAAIFERVLEADPNDQRARAGLERMRGAGRPATAPATAPAVAPAAAPAAARRDASKPKADRAAVLRSYLRRLRGGA